MLNFSITFLITFFNIGILYFILRAVLFKPVTKFMDARSAKIKGDLQSAAAERIRAEELTASYEERLRKIDEDTELILREARATALEQSALIIERGKAEAARLVDVSRQQIEAERRTAAASFKAEAAGLVMAATGRLLKREASAEDAHRAVSEFVAELATSSDEREGE